MLRSGQTVEACLGGLVVSLVPSCLSTWHIGSYTPTSRRQLQSQRNDLMAFSAIAITSSPVLIRWSTPIGSLVSYRLGDYRDGPLNGRSLVQMHN